MASANRVSAERPVASPEPVRSFDAQGQVFLEPGRVLRGIFPGHGDRCRRILQIVAENDLFRFGIVRTALASNVRLPGGPYELILEHERVPFISYPHEWSASMLKDAALFHLELFMRLAPYGLGLKDMHPLNVLFDGTKPVFVDFTSIIEAGALASEEYLQSARKPWRASWTRWDRQSDLLNDMYERMFVPYFLLPMEMMARSRHASARERMLGTTLNTGGSVITRGEAYGSRPVTRFRNLTRRIALDAALGQSGHAKALFFQRLSHYVAGIQVQPPISDYVTFYQQKGEDFDIRSSSNWNVRQHTVNSILEHLRPETVLDVAGNTGWFARLAASKGAKVVAFDIDESSADRLYLDAKAGQENVLSLVLDATRPTPKVRAASFPNEPRREFEDAPVLLPAPHRLKCELTMALAIVHHLALGQGKTLPEIVEMLDGLTERHLVVEFVARNDELIVADPGFFPAMQGNPDGFDWYGLQSFEAELGKRFATIERLPSHPGSRTILLCSR
jgi:hypothetical protein